jgi:beta-lactamase regulating signal transducer with metallopeptidase domain
MSISFISYRLFLRKDNHFRYLRIFLTGSLLISLLLPLLSIRIDYSELFRKAATVNDGYMLVQPAGDIVTSHVADKGFFTAHLALLAGIYLTIVLLFSLRIFIQLINLLRLYAVSEKEKRSKNIILTTSSIKSPFSFFRLIFIPSEISDKEEVESIIAHENIHASQLHSLDNLFIELISAVMWFNPFVWRMKSSLHLVHEYLADEGALDTGIDRLRYQTLLLNHVSEENLVCLSSGLNHSLIKKRMIMMTKSKNNQGKKLKILTLVPLSAVLLLAVALLNGVFPQQAKAEKPKAVVNITATHEAPPVTAVPTDTVKKKVVIIKSSCDNKGNKEGEKKCEKKCEKKIFIVKSAKGEVNSKGDSITYVIKLNDNNTKEINSDEIETVTVTDSDTTIVLKCKDMKKGHSQKIIIMTDEESIPDNTLILLDGKEVTQEEFKKIDPETIEKIDIVKGAEQVKILGYSDKYDGIITITTKK